MEQQLNLQQVPVKAYRTEDHLTVAAPMPGLAPEDITVEINEAGHLHLHGALRGDLKNVKQTILNEWMIGEYHRDLELPLPVDGPSANVSYDNGVLVVVLPISDTVRPAKLQLTTVGRGHGQYLGHSER